MRIPYISRRTFITSLIISLAIHAAIGAYVYYKAETLSTYFFLFPLVDAILNPSVGLGPLLIAVFVAGLICVAVWQAVIFFFCALACRLVSSR